MCIQLFLPFPLFASSLRCVCVADSLSLVAQVVQSVEKHTLGARFCHIMFLFGLGFLISGSGARFRNRVGRRDSHLTIWRSVQQAYW